MIARKSIESKIFYSGDRFSNIKLFLFNKFFNYKKVTGIKL